MTVAQVASLTSFTAGQTISSADVNSNFAALRNAFNLLITANNTFAASMSLPGVTMTGHLLFTDATYDIGASGATRPRHLYMSGTATIAGDAKLSTAGSGLYVKEGTNATMGTGTISGGTATINTTKVTANSRIFLCKQDVVPGATAEEMTVSARTAGTSFTVSTTSASEGHTFAWFLLEPA